MRVGTSLMWVTSKLSLLSCRLLFPFGCYPKVTGKGPEWAADRQSRVQSADFSDLANMFAILFNSDTLSRIRCFLVCHQPTTLLCDTWLPLLIHPFLQDILVYGLTQRLEVSGPIHFLKVNLVAHRNFEGGHLSFFSQSVGFAGRWDFSFLKQRLSPANRWLGTLADIFITSVQSDLPG